MVHSSLLKEDVKMAMETLFTHKVRSFLTVLGVVIGVMVAVLVASILLGFQANVQASLDEFGVDNILIHRFDIGIRFGRMSPEERMRKPLTFEDGMAIRDELPAVKEVSMQIGPRAAQPQPVRTARYKGKEVSNNLFRGVTASYAQVRNARMKEGRFFTEQEDLHRVDEVVMGFDIANTMSPNEDLLGKELQIDGSLYTVVGILDKKKSTLGGTDNELLIPYRTYQKHYPNDDENVVIAMAHPGMKDIAEDQVRSLLRVRRRVPFDKPDNFGMSSAEQLGDQFRQIMAGIVQLVVGIVSIGLLVGGVGVMNIMLMSVTERTREIGVRKAIGARRRDISFQFITEAVVLTGLGGIIGIILSLGISLLLKAISFPSAIPVAVMVIAVAVSAGVGLFFGIYPAVKAARLDPVVALRYE